MPTPVGLSNGQRSHIAGFFQDGTSRMFKGSTKLRVGVGQGRLLARTREQSEHICVHHQMVTVCEVSSLGTTGVK